VIGVDKCGESAARRGTQFTRFTIIVQQEKWGFAVFYFRSLSFFFRLSHKKRNGTRTALAVEREHAEALNLLVLLAQKVQILLRTMRTLE